MTDSGFVQLFAPHEFLRDLSDRHRMILASGARPFTAKPGELRWYATVDDKDLEVENGKPFEHKVYKDAPGGHQFNRLDTKYARESRAEVYRYLAKYLNPPDPVK